MTREVDSKTFRGRTAVVVGLGASGRAAAELLVKSGAEVIANDRSPRDGLASAIRQLEANGVEVVVGTHEGDFWQRADLIVVSPGVPSFPQLRSAEESGTEVIGETELASRFIDVPLLAVGGTNGKSTATTLLGHMVEAAGHRAFVGANLGEPACEAPRQKATMVVFEVSSFQMERVPTFRPKVGVLLNVSEDHLDRYDGFDDYVAAKGNCFANQTADDFAVVPVGDARILDQVHRGKGQVVTFGKSADQPDYAVDGHTVVERRSGHRFELEYVDLHGGHNYLNAAAAVASARAVGLSIEDVEEGLARFRALPHRMALAGRYRNVAYYDDSKATNVGAAVTALRGLTEEKGVLVAGGRDKMGSYDKLVEALAERGRGAVVIGEAAERLREAIGDVVPVEVASSIQGAVHQARHMARPGDAVLLSPACSSLDMFKNFAERGRRFTEAVGALSETEERP